jgi:hypothetical protein
MNNTTNTLPDRHISNVVGNQEYHSMVSFLYAYLVMIAFTVKKDWVEKLKNAIIGYYKEIRQEI